MKTRTVACVILTGTGEKAFCAGGDMLEMSGVEERQRRELAQAPAASSASSRARPCPSSRPSTATASAAAHASPSAAISASPRPTRASACPGSEYGLVVAAASLPRLVGAARAKELIFTARKFGAQEAFDYGLVTSLHEPAELMDAAWAMGETIASMSRSAVSEAKRVIDAATLSDEARHMEDDANKRLRGSPEQVDRFRNATRKVTGR